MAHSPALPHTSTAPLVIPDDAVVVMMGAPGSGKSHLARRLFPAETIVSSDALRRRLTGSEADLSRDAVMWPLLDRLVEARARSGRLTVVDSTGGPATRARLLAIARRTGRPAVAIVLDHPLEECLAGDAARSRHVPEDVIRERVAAVHAAVAGLRAEGFSATHVLRGREATLAVRVSLTPAPARRHPGLGSLSAALQ